jgi:xylulokinase
MHAPLLLGIDLGTSGTKATLVDRDGRTVASATVEHPTRAPHPGHSEQDPEDWWRSTIGAVRAAVGDRGRSVAALGLTGQMHGLVMVDAGGATLRPCILWNDQRSAPQCGEIEARIGVERLLEWTGNRMLPGFQAPKILWCREHEPHLERRAAKHLLPKDWLRWRLAGRYATDVSDASGTLLFDCARRRWSADLLAALAIDRSTLPECSESIEVTAALAKTAAAELGLPEGLPISAGAGDQAASAVAAGIVEEGRVSITVGTSGVAFAASAAWRRSERGELHAFCHAVPGQWHLMGVMLSAGGSLRWYRDTLGGGATYDELAAEAIEIAPGSDGLLFLPYLTGERCPHPDPHARGTLIGLTPGHRRAHLTRAVFEGITFGLRDNLDLIRAAGVSPTSVALAGGGARSRFWRPLCADTFGVPVDVAAEDEGSSLGAALLAGVAVGVWSTVETASAAAGKARSSQRIEPEPSAAAQLRPALHRYRTLYRALAGYFAQPLIATG